METLPPAAELAVKTLLALGAGYFASWNLVVGVIGIAFVLSRHFPLWFLPALFGALVIGFTDRVSAVISGGVHQSDSWTAYLLELIGYLPQAVVLFVLVVSVGRFLYLLSVRVVTDRGVKYVCGTAFAVLLLGAPFALRLGDVQQWVVRRFELGLVNLEASEVLALLSVVVGAPAVLTVLPWFLFRLFRYYR